VIATAALGVDGWVWAACLVVVFVGALVQGTIGMGLGTLGAPLLALADPGFVPVGILLAVIPLTLTMAWRERHHVDRAGISWAIAGRVPGTFLAVWVLARADHTVLTVIIAVTVLLAVTAASVGIRVRPSRRNLAAAGVASGFTGTAAGIGGPPMALTYQYGEPAVIRSTLAVYFVIGLAISLASLTVGGVIDRHQIALGLALVPASIAGTVVAPRVAGRLPVHQVRVAVLAVCAVSAVLLLLQQLP